MRRCSVNWLGLNVITSANRTRAPAELTFASPAISGSDEEDGCCVNTSSMFDLFELNKSLRNREVGLTGRFLLVRKTVRHENKIRQRHRLKGKQFNNKNIIYGIM